MAHEKELRALSGWMFVGLVVLIDAAVVWAMLNSASVDGFDAKGRRRMLEKAYFVEPLEINGKSLRAIQTTTAAPLCQSAMMLLTDKYKGVISQSSINPTEFLDGSFVSRVYR